MLLLGANALIKVTPGLMIWTIICFLIALFVLKRYAFGPIQSAIDERRERIRESIEEADRAREEARKLLEEHRKLIGQAKCRRGGDPRRGPEAGRRPARARPRGDRGRPRSGASRRRRSRSRRRPSARSTQIRAEVAELTLVATAKVTGKVLDRDDQRKLIEDAISELDFSVLERND